MIKFLGLLLFVAFGLTSCSNQQAKLDAKTEIGKVNDFLKQYEESSQTFSVLADKPSKVKGKKGTIIAINPADLMTEDGQLTGKNIEVELKELTNQEDLLKSNAQTTSNGQLLVSGGAYFINMTSQGRQLKLKEGKSLSVQFPKLSNKEMSLFYGQRDSLGNINWIQADQKFIKQPTKERIIKTETYDGLEMMLSRMDTSYHPKPLSEQEIKQRAADRQEKNKNQQVENNLYQAIEIQKFGWINCDKFYNSPNITNLQFAVNDKDSTTNAIVYLVFKDINSIMTSNYFSSQRDSMNLGFVGVPIGAKTKIIACSIRNGNAYIFKSDLTIKADQTIELTLKETSQEQIKKLFQSN